MVKISAFQSLIPEIKFISQVPTKAYSNYSKSDLDLEIKNNPYSFLNIIAKNEKINPEKRLSYIRDKIDHFKKKMILKTQRKKSIYIYRKTDLKNTYTGLICAISLKDYANKKIKVHEKTIKRRELLFAEYLKTTKIYAEPVLMTIDGELNKIIDKHIENTKKTYNFHTNDGVQHEIWEIKKNEDISHIISFFDTVQNLYIADGHHRMASSLINNQQGMCLAYILGKDQLKTYPFHRKISNIENVNSIFSKLNKLFNVISIKNPKKNIQDLQFYINKKWYRIELENNKNRKLIEQLLVSKLAKKILNPVFNIKDERKDKNVIFIPGNRNMKEEISKIKKNEILFFMNTIDINTIIQIAKKGQTTPPKSTFILPKLPSGLIMMELK